LLERIDEKYPNEVVLIRQVTAEQRSRRAHNIY